MLEAVPPIFGDTQIVGNNIVLVSKFVMLMLSVKAYAGYTSGG